MILISCQSAEYIYLQIEMYTLSRKEFNNLGFLSKTKTKKEKRKKQKNKKSPRTPTQKKKRKKNLTTSTPLKRQKTQKTKQKWSFVKRSEIKQQKKMFDAVVYFTYTYQYQQLYKYIFKYRRNLLFQVRTRLLIPDFGPWRHKKRDTILTMLTPPKRGASHDV